jgi:hypothetical protein
MEGAQCLPIRFLGAATMTYAVSWGDHTTTPNLQPCKNKIPLLTDAGLFHPLKDVKLQASSG